MLTLSTQELGGGESLLEMLSLDRRSIVWLQQQREAEQRGRGGGSALRGEHRWHCVQEDLHQVFLTFVCLFAVP